MHLPSPAGRCFLLEILPVHSAGLNRSSPASTFPLQRHPHFCVVIVLVIQLYPTLCNPMNCIVHQAPLSMEFSRQEYWSGLPFPSPGDLPDPGIKLRSPALQADSLPAEPPGKSSVEVCDLTVRKGVGSVPSMALWWRCQVSCSLLCWPKWKNLNEFFGHLHVWEVESKAQKEHSEHPTVVVGEVIFNVQAGCVPVEGVHNCEKPECPGGKGWSSWDHPESELNPFLPPAVCAYMFLEPEPSLLFVPAICIPTIEMSLGSLRAVPMAVVAVPCHLLWDSVLTSNICPPPQESENRLHLFLAGVGRIGILLVFSYLGPSYYNSILSFSETPPCTRVFWGLLSTLSISPCHHCSALGWLSRPSVPRVLPLLPQLLICMMLRCSFMTKVGDQSIVSKSYSNMIQSLMWPYLHFLRMLCWSLLHISLLFLFIVESWSFPFLWFPVSCLGSQSWPFQTLDGR